MIVYNVLWYLAMYYDSLQCIMRSFKVLWYLTMYYDILQCIMIVYKVLCDLTKYYDTLQCVMRSFKVLCDLTKYYDILQCVMRSFKVLRDSIKLSSNWVHDVNSIFSLHLIVEILKHHLSFKGNAKYSQQQIKPKSDLIASFV